MLFDWLVIGQVVPNNPGAAVSGPRELLDRPIYVLGCPRSRDLQIQACSRRLTPR